MADDKFYRERDFKMGWERASAFLTTAQGLNTANAAGDTYYYFPLRIISEAKFWIKRARYYERVAGQKFLSYFAYGSLEDGMFEFTGPLIDLSMMYQLCKACTTADATPGATYYTHTYATTTSQTDPPPSLNLLMGIPNGDTGNSLYPLFLGCCVSYFKCGSRDINGEIEGTLRIKFSKTIAGNNLTTWPSYPGKEAHRLDRTSITLTKATVAYPGKAQGFELEYNDQTSIMRFANEQYASEAANGNPEIFLWVYWAVKSDDLINDVIIDTTSLAAITDSDVDSTIKMYRDATYDYLQFAFEKLWAVDYTTEWVAYQDIKLLVVGVKYVIKSTVYEADGKLTITQVDQLDDDRFET